MQRIQRRSILAAVLIFLAASAGPALARPADASADWCWDDPIVSVGGRLVDIRVGMPLANLLTMRSTTLTVVIPANVSGVVLVDDISAFPMETTISRSGPAWNGTGPIPITVVARVAATTSYPVQVIATPVTSLSGGLHSTLDNTLGLLSPSSATGRSNATVSLSMALK